MFPTRSTQTPDEVVAQSALTQQVEQFERKLVAQQRKDKEQRQSEQIKMQIQLKDFQNQLMQQQKRDFEHQQQEQQHFQQQVQAYQQKLIQQQQQQQVAGITGQQQQPCLTGQQIQQQIREYERILVERQQHDIDRRQRVHYHLQQKLNEAERILAEQQQMEFQHLIHNQEQLQTIQNGSLDIMGTTGSQLWAAEKSQVLEQQTQEEKTLKHKQEHLQKIVKELESELNLRDIEHQKSQVNSHLRHQQVHQQVQQALAQQFQQQQQQPIQFQQQQPIQFQQQQQQVYLQSAKIEQIQQLEQQLCEYKRILREKLQQQSCGGIYEPALCGVPVVNGIQTQTVCGVPVVPTTVTGIVQQQIQQALTQEWIKELVQKLRNIEQQALVGQWAQKKLQQLKQHIMFFEQVELPQQQYQCVPQLMKLRNFVNYELQQEIQQQITGQYCQQQQQQQHVVLRQLVNELVQYLCQVQPVESMISGMPVEKLFSKLRSMEYRLRELRQYGECEPQWAPIYSKIYQLEQQFLQPQYFQQQPQCVSIVNGVTGITGITMPLYAQKMEYIQEHIQQLEWLIQEAVCVQRQIPYKYQVTKYQQSKQLIKRLVQLIEECECQVQEVKIQQQLQQQVCGTQQQQQLVQQVQYQSQMVLRQLRGLRSQLKCLLQQQTLITMHNRFQQLVNNYEIQMPQQHTVQVQQICAVLKGLEQQLIEQHVQIFNQQQQQFQQQTPYTNGVSHFNVESVFEQAQQQFQYQKTLQQAIKDFATLFVQTGHQQQVPQQIRMQIQQGLLQQCREFEIMLGQCCEILADQEQYFNYNGQQQQQQQMIVPQLFVQQYQTQHQQFQTLFKQLQQVLTQVQLQHQQIQLVQQPIQTVQQQQLVNTLVQLLQQVQIQHQQQQYQQGQCHPQYLWCLQQKLKPCYTRLQQKLQQLQQLQYLPTGDMLQQQQYYILFKQVQKQLQQLNFLQQHYQRSSLLKNWQSWTQVHLPQLQQQLQQLRQQQMQVRLIQQQLHEIVTGRMLNTIVTPFGGLQTIRQQMIKSLSQQQIVDELQQQQQQQLQQQQQQQVEQQLTGMDGNNNIFSSWCVVEPSTLETCEDLIVSFFAGGQIEQEKIVAELVQQYVDCQVNGVETNNAFRRRFEQIYFENNKLGQQLRALVCTMPQLHKQFEEMQITRTTGLTATAITGVTGPAGLNTIKYQIGNKTMPYAYRTEYESLIPILGEEIMPFGTTTTTSNMIPYTYQQGQQGIMQQIQQQIQQQQIQLQQQQQPSLRCVEQMLNNLENKFTQLKLENEYPCIQVTGPVSPVPLYGLEQPTYGIRSYATMPQQQYGSYIQETLGQQQQQQQVTVEITKQSQNGLTQTQVFAESKTCPVCGVIGEKELSQPEFELHVNSHF